MLPYFHIIRRDVPLYGLWMILGAAAGWLVCKQRARRYAPFVSQDWITRSYLFVGAGALVGAKIYSFALVWPQLVRDISLLWTEPQQFLASYIYGGLVFYGGLLGGLCCAGGLLLWRKVSFELLEPVYLPAVPLVHSFGRVGCFFAGCCYGVPTDQFFGVLFPEGGLAPSGVPLVPIQLFEAAGDLVLFMILSMPFYSRKGTRLAAYLAGYGALRFVTERYRGDAVRGFWGPLSEAQWISLFCITAGCVLIVFLLVYPWYRSRKAFQKNHL